MQRLLSFIGLYHESRISIAGTTESLIFANSSLYKVIVHSGLFLGLCVMAYTFAIMQFLHMPYDPLILVIAFLAGYAPYNFNRVMDGREDSINNLERVIFVRKSRSVFLALLIGSYASIFLITVFHFSLSVFLVSLFPLTLVLLYTVK